MMNKDSLNIRLGVILSYVGMFVSIIGSLIVSNRILNYIGDYNYGLYSFVNSITMWLTVVSSALTASYLRFSTMELKSSGNVKKTNTIYLKMLGMIGFLVIFFGILIILTLFFSNINLGKYNWEDSKLMYFLFLISIFNIGISMPCNIFSLYINFKKEFIFGKIIAIVISILTFFGNFLIAFLFRSVILLSLFSIVITLINLCFNFVFSRKKLGISFGKAALRENKTLLNSIVVFSGILLLNSIVDQVNTNVDKTLLGIFSIPENVTIYQMGQQLAGYLTTMSVSVSGVFAPTIHELVLESKNDKIDSLFLKVSKIQIVILCCVVFGFLCAGKNFVIWWIGEKRVNSFYVCFALMLISLCPLTMNSSIEIQRARNKHLFRAITYIVLAILNILLSIIMLNILDDAYSIYACLLGTIVTTFLSHWILMNIYNKNKMGLSVGKYLINLFLYMFVGFISFVLCRVISSHFIHAVESYFFKFVIESMVFAIIYFIFIVLFNHRIILASIKDKILKKQSEEVN